MPTRRSPAATSRPLVKTLAVSGEPAPWASSLVTDFSPIRCFGNATWRRPSRAATAESLATCGRTTLLEAYWRSLAAMVFFQEQFVDARVRLRLDRTLVNDDLHRAKEKLEPVTGRSKAEAARLVWMNFAKLQVPKLQADPRRQRCSCRVSPDGA